MTMPSIPGILATTALCLAAVVGLGRAQKVSACIVEKLHFISLFMIDDNYLRL